ncbi:hypothetical protein [Halalkalibacillus halophilus]|nr:hypothetical protein [Halalkalibacillus halophilus]
MKKLLMVVAVLFVSFSLYGGSIAQDHTASFDVEIMGKKDKNDLGSLD